MTGEQRVQRLSLLLHSHYLAEAKEEKQPAAVLLIRDLIALYRTRSTIAQLRVDFDLAFAEEDRAENPAGRRLGLKPEG